MLSPRQIDSLTDATLRLHEARSIDELFSLTASVLRELVPGDLHLVSFAPSLLPAKRFVYSPQSAGFEAVLDRGAAYAHEDPVYTSRLRLLLDGPGSPTAMAGPDAVHRTDYFRSSWAPLGVSRVLSSLSPGRLGVGIALGRTSAREFSKADIALVRTLGRHADAAGQRLVRRDQGRAQIAGRSHGVQLFDWLVCDDRGVVLRTTDAATAMMRRCLGGDTGASQRIDRLPAHWLDELRSRARGGMPKPFWYTVDGSPVSVHIAPIRPTPNEFSVGFLVHPPVDAQGHALRRLGLTARQAEVLHWVSRGKSNADVGVILGCSALTVKKHLEAVFHVLGVENRTAAVVVAMDAQRGAMPGTMPEAG